MTIQEYLEKVSIFVDDGFGRQVRQRFGDNLGSGELGILGSPSSDELDQLSRAVAIMVIVFHYRFRRQHINGDVAYQGCLLREMILKYGVAGSDIIRQIHL